MAETTNPPTPTEQTPAQWNEEFKEHWMNLRLAHEGLMLEDIQKRNLKVHELADAVRNGTIGKPASAPTEGDDVGVSIGNKQYHYHYETTQAAQANTTTTEASPAMKATNTLGKIAAGAALLGAGGIGTVGIGMAIDYFTRPSPPVVVQPADTDTDTNSKLRFED